MSKDFKIVVVVLILIFASLLLLDKVPHNRFYKHPTIHSQEYFEQYPTERKNGIHIKWTYENFEGLCSPAISPDGQYVTFITTVDNKRSLTAMDKRGTKLWHNETIAAHLLKEQSPTIVANSDSIVVYFTDTSEDTSTDKERAKILYYDRSGKLRWTQKAWGKLLVRKIAPQLFLSRYTKRHLVGWEEKAPALPHSCLDPEIKGLGGGDVLAYDERGLLCEIEPTSGAIAREHAIIGVEAISPKYIVTSCVGNTGIYNSSYERMTAVPAAGYVKISPDEEFIVIRVPNGKSEQQDEVSVYTMHGELLWKKSVLSYTPNIMGSDGGDHGIIALRGGYIGVLSAQYRDLEYVDVKLTLFDSRGNVVWSKTAINDKALNLAITDAPGSGLIVSTKQRFDTMWWPNTKLSEIFQYFGILGTPTRNYKQNIYFVDIHGRTRTSSPDIISESPFRSLDVDYTNKHIIAADGKLYFLEVFYDQEHRSSDNSDSLK